MTSSRTFVDSKTVLASERLVNQVHPLDLRGQRCRHCILVEVSRELLKAIHLLEPFQ